MVYAAATESVSAATVVKYVRPPSEIASTSEGGEVWPTGPVDHPAPPSGAEGTAEQPEMTAASAISGSVSRHLLSFGPLIVPPCMPVLSVTPRAAPWADLCPAWAVADRVPLPARGVCYCK